MNKEFSELIRSLRLVMVMGLVFVHFGNFPGEDLDPFTGVINATYPFASSFNSFFTYFFLCSVPVLSLISGYLYCYQGEPSFLKSLKKKSKTLVLPTITWTSLWLLVAFTLYSIGKSSNQFTYYDQGFSDYNLLDLLNGIIGVTETPFAFQFWFIHDLVLSILITPLVIPIIKRFGLIIVLIPFTLWILEIEPIAFFNYKVVAFFNIGIYLGLNKFKPELPTTLWKYNLTIPIFITLVLVRIYVPAFNEGVMPLDTVFELFLRLMGSVAIVTLVLNLRVYCKTIYQFLVNRSGYAFFLHAFHFPLVIIIKQVLSMTNLFNGEAGLIILWIFTIILTILSSMITANILNKFIPPLYKILNGQRSI